VPTQEKVQSLGDLKQWLADARTAVLTEYRGLSVRQLSDLRKQLKSASASCRVVKNRIAKLAIADSALRELAPHLKGPTAIVFSAQDPVAVAKTLQGFAKVNQQLLIKAGYVEGQVLPADGMKALADLPSREALRGQLVATLEGPLTQLVGLLNAPLRELVYVLDQRGGAEKTEAS
jgi:large subunit ribosomal protein L10